MNGFPFLAVDFFRQTPPFYAYKYSVELLALRAENLIFLCDGM